MTQILFLYFYISQNPLKLILLKIRVNEASFCSFLRSKDMVIPFFAGVMLNHPKLITVS